MGSPREIGLIGVGFWACLLVICYGENRKKYVHSIFIKKIADTACMTFIICSIDVFTLLVTCMGAHLVAYLYCFLESGLFK